MPVPAMPTGEVQLEPPPEIPRLLPGNVMSALLPGVMILGSVGFIFIGGLSAASMAMGGLILLSTLGMMGGGMGGRKTGRKAQIDTDRKDYLRYIEQVRRDIDRIRLGQRTSLLWSHPDPRSLWSIAGGRRMWERRPNDRDFSTVRVGVGPQRLARQLRPPQTGLIESLDPIGAVALRRLVRAHALVDDLPVAVKLRSFPAIEVRGARAEVRDLVRAMLAELTTFHGPDHVIVGVVTSGPSRTDWDWVKWLPHAQDPRESDAVGSRRLVAGSLAELEEWLAPEMSTRARFARDVTPAPDQPHVVIVIDGGAVSLEERVLLEDGLVGVTIIDLSSSIGRLAARRGLRLVVEDGKVGAVGRNGVEVLGRADRLGVTEADAVARRMAPWRVGAAETTDEQPLLTSAELVDMLGVGDPENVQRGGTLAPAHRPRPAAHPDRRGRARRAGGARHQGGRARGDGPARAGDRGDRFGQVRAAAHARARPGDDALAQRAQPDPGRLQGRRDLPRPQRPAAHRRGDHQPAGRPDAGRPHARRAGR